MSNEKKKSGCLGNLLKIFGLLLVLGIAGTLLVPRDEVDKDASAPSPTSSTSTTTPDSSIATPVVPAISEEATSARASLPMSVGEIERTSGDTYKASTITKFEPDGLTVMHESGVLKIPFAELPQKLQDTFGYSEAEARNYQQELQAVQQTQQAAQNKQGKIDLQKKIDEEFTQGCIDAGWVTYIEQDNINHFYVRLPAAKYTTKDNIESVANYIAKAYVMQNKNKNGSNTSATVHVFKDDKVVARGRFSQ